MEKRPGDKRLGPQTVPTLFIVRWTVEIMYALKERLHRHGELRRRLGQISQRMLTRTLRNLESAGMISRQETRSRSLAVEYALTRLGRSFIVPLTSVCRWAGRHDTPLRAVFDVGGTGDRGAPPRSRRRIRPAGPGGRGADARSVVARPSTLAVSPYDRSILSAEAPRSAIVDARQ